MELVKRLIIRFRRIISFGIIGIVNTVFDFIVFTVCYSVAGLSPGLSQASGYMGGVVCSFILNRAITFKDATRALPSQIILFILVNAVSFLVSTYLIDLLSARGMHTYIAKVLVTGISMLINYFGYKALVFKVAGNGKENSQHE